MLYMGILLLIALICFFALLGVHGAGNMSWGVKGVIESALIVIAIIFFILGIVCILLNSQQKKK